MKSSQMERNEQKYYRSFEADALSNYLSTFIFLFVSFEKNYPIESCRICSISIISSILQLQMYDPYI